MQDSQSRESGQDASGSSPRGVVFSLQGLVGFTIGGLLALVVTLASGLYATGWVVVAGRVLAYAAGGAIGGAALGTGLRPGAWKSGALGFGLGFILPALLAGGDIAKLFALDMEGYNSNTFVLTVLSFALSYGLAAAFGASFLQGRLWLPVGFRFLVAAGLGGLIAASGPKLAGEPSSYSQTGIITALGVVFTGHMAAWALSGWLGGLAIESDVRARVKRRPRARSVRPRTPAKAGEPGVEPSA